MQKYIWAVDPFAKDMAPQLATFKALVNLAKATGAEIEPVTVLGPDQTRVPASVFKSKAGDYRLDADKRLSDLVKKAKFSRLKPYVLLVQELHSSGATVDVLLKHARDTKTSLIGVGTFARKAWEKFFLGSFAETLVLKSDVPLLVVNPKAKLKKITKILFPTDFSPKSLEAYERVLGIAKALKARVILFHNLEAFYTIGVSSLGVAPDYRRLMENDRESKKTLGNEWIGKAANQGVKAEFVLADKPYYVVSGILKAADKKSAGLIAFASHSGALAATVLGSVARQVVRMSKAPVWVIHG